MNSMNNGTDTPDIIIKCGGCSKAYRIHPEKLPPGVTSFPCRSCGSLIPLDHIEPDQPAHEAAGSVLIAVEEDELGRLIQRILGRNGYHSSMIHSGKAALEALEGGGSDLFLVSVYLPDMMGYELLDRLAHERFSPRIPSILLSAVHHAARYKRAPTSLYGADDYLERHHLPDLLIPKVRRLLAAGGQALPKVTPADVPPLSDEQVLQRRDLETMERTGADAAEGKMEILQRMCRVIVGDIALYNEDIIGSTLPENLLDAIAADLHEGEVLLLNKFPEMKDQLPHLLRREMARLLNSRGIQVT